MSNHETDPEFDNAFSRFLNELELDSMADGACIPMDDAESERTDLARDDVYNNRLPRLGIDAEEMVSRMRDWLAAKNPNSLQVMLDWIVSNDVETIIGYHPLIAGTPEEQTVNPLTGAYDPEQEAIRDRHKLDEGYRLVHEYGEAASLPLRRLLDDLVPFRKQVSELTERDLHTTVEGREYLERAARSKAFAFIISKNAEIQKMMLEQGLGVRDDAARHAGALGRIALARVKGGVHAAAHPVDIADLIGTYPGREAQLTEIVEEISRLLLSRMPDFVLAEDSWAPIILNPDYNDEVQD